MQVQADGSWVCESCRSLNSRKAARCYRCRGISPLTSLQAAKRSSSRPTRVLAVLAVVISVAGLLAGTAVVTGKLSPAPSTSFTNPIAYVSVGPVGPDATRTPLVTDTPSSSVVTPAPTPTFAPPDPTAAATRTPARTARPTIAPKPSSTPVPTTPAVAPVTASPATTVPLPVISVSIPGSAVEFFPVSGATEFDLISSDLSTAPSYCGGVDSAACFHHTFKWTYMDSVDAQTQVCTVTSVTFTPTYLISLPEWTSPTRVSPALAAWWRKVMDHFVWHESQHLAIAESYVAQLKSAILSGPCSQAGQDLITNPIAAQMDAAQAAFDAQDKSWNWPAM